jgi:hypothetical protein
VLRNCLLQQSLLYVVITIKTLNYENFRN